MKKKHKIKITSTANISLQQHQMLPAIHPLALHAFNQHYSLFPLGWATYNRNGRAGMQQASQIYQCGKALSQAPAKPTLLKGTGHVKWHI